MPTPYGRLHRWPPPLAAYGYTKHLTRSRWAWEFLRRNEDYRRDWRLSAPGRPRPIILTTATRLYRLRRRYRQAEQWRLCTFRRSGPRRA
jgi:hypothetical protein